MKEDPIQYAKNMAIKSIDEDKGYIFPINNIKLLIKEYFSDNLQIDETPMGALKRSQIRKELLEFANK